MAIVWHLFWCCTQTKPCEYWYSVALTFVLSWCCLNWVTAINPARQVWTGVGAADPLTHFLRFIATASQHWSIPRRRQHTGQFVHVCSLGHVAWLRTFYFVGQEQNLELKKGRNERKLKGMIWLFYQEYRQRNPDVTVSHCSRAVVLTHDSCSRLRGVMTT